MNMSFIRKIKNAHSKKAGSLSCSINERKTQGQSSREKYRTNGQEACFRGC